MLTMFLDESGDHSLNKIDPEYPIFVLGGCIFKRDYYDSHVEPKLTEYKTSLFGRSDFILHTVEIARRRGIFKKLTDGNFRQRFYEETNRLMSGLDYTVVACVIDKTKHLAQYGLSAYNPYDLSLKILVERFVFEISKRGKGCSGHMEVESRDRTLNNGLLKVWNDIKMNGTEYLSSLEVSSAVSGFQISSKDKNIAGLQVADLIVSPIGRHYLGKSPKNDWLIIQSKFRRNSRGNYKGYGLKILP